MKANPRGKWDGCCFIYKDDMPVGECILGPYVLTEKEAILILRSAAEKRINYFISESNFQASKAKLMQDPKQG